VDKIINVGFLIYDLQQFSEDCLYRIQENNPDIALTAYPVVEHANQGSSRIKYKPSSQKGSYFGVDAKGGTPEGFASNINFKAAWACVYESDVIVLFGLQGITALLTVAFSILLFKPVVSVNQTLPVEWELKRRWWIILLKRLIFKKCILNISQSVVSREVLTKIYSIPDSLIVDAPFEAGASLFRRRIDEIPHDSIPIFTRNQNETIFLFSGNLHHFKGVGTIIKALAIIESNINIKCFFAGPEANSNSSIGTVKYWICLARSLGVEHRVTFLGQLNFDQLISAYRSSDVVLLPTQKDCFPKVLVEAAIFSKPLISTSACGATGTILINKINGLVIKPDDPVALADSMMSLLDKDKRAEMGRQSKLIVDRICHVNTENTGYQNAFKLIRQLLDIK
jgi:glycosyltransferase involved in cell wall biosynthesis